MFKRRPFAAALLLSALAALTPAHADIYGYVDDKGVAHFAAEKMDDRYQLFFRGGQSFDTANGLGQPGGVKAAKPAKAANGADGAPKPASQALLALFERSPNYKSTKAALREAARKHAIDYELLQALIATESGFDAQAISPKGAMGLMQLMPGTAERFGVQADLKRSLEDKLHDPKINIAAGSRYLRHLIGLFPGRIELALAAYNAGEGAVKRAGNKIPNYKETQNYVKTVLQLYAYLKPDAAVFSAGVGAGAVGGSSGSASGVGTAGGAIGRVLGRIRMEMPGTRGGAVGRGNLPADGARGAAGAALPDTSSGVTSGAAPTSASASSSLGGAVPSPLPPAIGPQGTAP